MQKFNTPIPLGLYIHLPWCVQKCPYCDFNSHALKTTIPEKLYQDALIYDLEMQLPKIENRKLVSIFFGGGTPSLFSPDSIHTILTGIHARFPFDPAIEITLEANPGTVDESRFLGFRQAGINRLSLGIQSLQNEKLRILGRIHDSRAALTAIESAKSAGFENFNVDLMHGLPGQTERDALSDIQTILQYRPPHFSWYQLTIEPNTVFYKKPPVLPKEETLWLIQDQGKAAIEHHGYMHYEISAYSLAKYECTHNKNYWEFGDYLGLGAGAHSKLTDLKLQHITRHVQPRQPTDYLTRRCIPNKTVLAERDIVFEFMLNALRLTQGFSLSLFSERTGLPLESLEPQLTQAMNKKLLDISNERITATELGRRFLNDIILMFLPKE